MPTKITFVIDNPDEPEAFERAYPEVLDLARALPRLQRLESARVWPKEDGTPTPAHRTLDLYFDSYEGASAAVATPPAAELFQQLLATGTPFTALFSEVEPR
ncbi:EthD domain-containing protein [Kineococcus sp. SYSU DK003]|uniref:EthD family reductase n=1 Tax=Kineococcus sp. SYSU DK003 TaxID=3383124 RepID=UPI003D7C4B46